MTSKGGVMYSRTRRIYVITGNFGHLSEPSNTAMYNFRGRRLRNECENLKY
jgi:hypothetical protein